MQAPRQGTRVMIVQHVLVDCIWTRCHNLLSNLLVPFLVHLVPFLVRLHVHLLVFPLVHLVPFLVCLFVHLLVFPLVQMSISTSRIASQQSVVIAVHADLRLQPRRSEIATTPAIFTIYNIKGFRSWNLSVDEQLPKIYQGRWTKGFFLISCTHIKSTPVGFIPQSLWTWQSLSGCTLVDAQMHMAHGRDIASQ